MTIAFTLAVWTLIAALVLYGLRLLRLLEATDEVVEEPAPRAARQLTLPAPAPQAPRPLVGATTSGDPLP
jgi:hypothetical protein